MEDVFGRRFLVFAGEQGPGARVCRELTSRGAVVVRVTPSEGFEDRGGNQFSIAAASATDYERLFGSLRKSGLLPDAILHFGAMELLGRTRWDGARNLLRPAGVHAGGGAQELPHVDFTVITTPVSEVVGGESLDRLKAAALGPCRVMPLEHPAVACRHLDLVHEEWAAPTDRAFEALLGELCARVAEPGGRLATGTSLDIDLRAGPSRSAGGAISRPATWRRLPDHRRNGGHRSGDRGASRWTAAARLVLTSRRGMPDRQAWDEHLQSHDEADPVSRAIRAVASMEQAGAEVLVLAADVADAPRMREVVEEARRRFGTIDGVVHAAGMGRWD